MYERIGCTTEADPNLHPCPAPPAAVYERIGCTTEADPNLHLQALAELMAERGKGAQGFIQGAAAVILK